MLPEKVKLENKNGTGILRPEEEIVFENSNSLKKSTKEKVKKEDINKLILDLKAVPYLDSSGIGFIISLLKFMREREGVLVITNLNDKVKRVCELTKLDEIIDIYENIEKALASLN